MPPFITLIAITVLSLWLAQASANADPRTQDDKARLARGVANFLSATHHSLDAITALSPAHADPASAILRGDLLSAYDLPRAAIETWRPALTRATSASDSNDLLLRLARQALADGDLDNARQHLQQVRQGTPAQADEKHFLLARIALTRKHYGDAADLTEKISANSIWRAYLHYELGIYLTENWEIGRKWLDRINHMVRYALDDPEFLALADQANLALALIALDKRNPTEASQHISRARKKGPTSNQSLLIAGWSWYRQNDPDKALAHWLMLRERKGRDKSSMEVLTAIARAYEKLGNREVAAINYELAAQHYATLRQEINDAIQGIATNELLTTLDREETPEAILASGAGVFTYLLPDILDKDFQREINHFRQLLEIRRKLDSWQDRLPLLNQTIDRQLAAIENRQSRLQEYSRPASFAAYKGRLAVLRNELDQIAGNSRVRRLADEQGRKHLRLLERISSSLERLKGQQDLTAEREKFRLLSGLVRFRMHNKFNQRVEEQGRALDTIATLLQKVEQKAQSLPHRIAARQQALTRIRDDLSTRADSIGAQLRQAGELLQRQGEQLNAQANNRLESRRSHLDKLYLNARHSQVRMLDELARTKGAGQ